MNGIRKKRYWNETGALVQEAVMDGLHRDPPCTDSPYRKEMKRRIWSTLRELDLQNSFEHGLPTLLHCLDSDVEAPANVEDSEFDEGSTTIPTKSASPFQYTRASYQHLSARSWRLRLDISRLLYGAGSSKLPSHEDVLRYTHEITEALDALPPITAEAAGIHALERPDIEAFMSAKPFLTCQLKDCMLALHRHRLRRGDANFSSFSESLCYTMSKDILSLYNAPSVGEESTSFLRADILTASLTITRIIFSQPASQSLNPRLAAAMKIDAPNYDSALALIEQCLPAIETRYLLSFHGEPWCPLTMLGAIMLIKIHLGEESHQTAKASIAARFLDLYYKHVAQQEADARKEYDLTTPSQPLASFDFCDFDLDWDQFMGVEQPGAVEQ
ncbi:hypothetical protein BR93DRAFT_626166 [Coniochaeta sp. PMI_546]|nr:hypothetical protein BR93DRAFT_626166 [Coniochaeta sp. PMI_546]